MEAGWQRSSIYPFDLDRILTNPIIATATKVTLDAEGLAVAEDVHSTGNNRPQTPPNQLLDSANIPRTTTASIRQIETFHKHNATPRSQRQFELLVRRAKALEGQSLRHLEKDRQLRQDTMNAVSQERRRKLKLDRDKRTMSLREAVRRRELPDLHL